ncbi:MAG: hypothetical protein ACT4R6_06815 [Gemmatimonadaceae bacterium]
MIPSVPSEFTANDYVRVLVRRAKEPGRSVLESQLESTVAQWLLSEGQLGISCRVDTSEAGPASAPSMAAEAEAIDVDGWVIHALLHLHDGYLRVVQFYRDDLRPIQKLPAPYGFGHAEWEEQQESEDSERREDGEEWKGKP